ncbi:hypothetical protein ANSO36C_42290 [Nostoc cf. commune SO-36]|uniref:MnmC-like methyltransferase domain-containing protein n=1 Tax=Nostoc cf. commune SO-36 TaxID=449208 RepID=A0ABN6QAH0_NOSCO|nr:hypothetical protein ANSO36C_42290 [Nostoc cf. commune SO-36]
MLAPDGLLATYSCAAAVRTALLSAGLVIGSTPPVGRRSPGTVAAKQTLLPRVDGAALANLPAFGGFSLEQLPSSRDDVFSTTLPLSQVEKEHLLTRAAVPYRDPQLSDLTEVIVMRRQQEQQTSWLEPTSYWRKRWLLGTQGRDFMRTSL